MPVHEKARRETYLGNFSRGNPQDHNTENEKQPKLVSPTHFHHNWLIKTFADRAIFCI